jgi:hypothetical protein
MFLPEEGRFLGEDPKEYVNGDNLYEAYFIPNGQDPTGEWNNLSEVLKMDGIPIPTSGTVKLTPVQRSQVIAQIIQQIPVQFNSNLFANKGVNDCLAARLKSFIDQVETDVMNTAKTEQFDIYIDSNNQNNPRTSGWFYNYAITYPYDSGSNDVVHELFHETSAHNWNFTNSQDHWL